MRHGVLRGGLVAVAVTLSAALAGPRETTAQDSKEVPKEARVFVYPEVVTAGDKLSDGRDRPIEITGPTTLVWIDRMPEARYEHPTQYVLISSTGTRVVEGGWWPVLNGKDLFRNGKPTTVKLPMVLSRE